MYLVGENFICLRKMFKKHFGGYGHFKKRKYKKAKQNLKHEVASVVLRQKITAQYPGTVKCKEPYIFYLSSSCLHHACSTPFMAQELPHWL